MLLYILSYDRFQRYGEVAKVAVSFHCQTKPTFGFEKY